MLNPRECYKPPEIDLHPISRSDIPLVSELLDREGWYSPLHTVKTLEDAFPGSFLGAYKGSSLVGFVAGVSYGPNLGAVGELIVDKKYRHLGYGIALADTKTAEVGIWDQNKSIYITSVSTMVDKYKSRYNFNESWKILMYSGTRATVKEYLPGIKCQELTQRNINMIFKYDSRIFPGNREKYWRNIIDTRNKCLGFVATSDGDAVSGFGIIHPCSSGYRIAPLYADSSETARCLLYKLTSNISETHRIVIEVPDINDAMKTIMTENGFNQQSYLIRLHTNIDIIRNVDRVFGISTNDISVI